ncbi:MAG: penicillin-binding protein 2 [Elusimicrobia bacterium]|nr:penicillin-binding protein 2 [Elusimicrobiota bacterium]
MNTQVSHQRLFHVQTAVYIFSLLAFFRFADIQIFKHDYFKQAADKNRTQVIYQTAPRGSIFSSNGGVIAASRPSFSLVYFPGRIKDMAYLRKLAQDFSPRLGLKPEYMMNVLENAFERGAPARIAQNLPLKTVFAFSEIKTDYPGIDIIVETKRHYPLGNFASHLIGYMGKMDAKDWEQAKASGLDYRFDSRTGKAGIEKFFESGLKGSDGGLNLEIDARGRLKQVLDRQDWKQGTDIWLTLNLEAQKAAEEGLKSSLTNKGAVVALNPQNGAILALASAPDFDPNVFVADIESLPQGGAPKEVPEFDMALSGTFAPGSTFKIITAISALETGRVLPSEKFYCPGYFSAGGRVFKCWERKGHGKMDFMEGMAHSCDVYFYNIGLKGGAVNIEQDENMFMLGQKTGINLSGEKQGHVFGPFEKMRTHRSWYAGDTLNLSIGQGELLVTPLQMAQVVSAVANGGLMWLPQYIKSIGQDGKFQPKLLRKIELKPQTWELIKNSLKDVIESGTGRSARIEGFDVYGKTGTAQNSQGEDNAWFVAFAQEPGKPSQIAVAVIVAQGGHGSASAAPIAKKILEAVIKKPAPAPSRRQKPAASLSPVAPVSPVIPAKAGIQILRPLSGASV